MGAKARALPLSGSSACLARWELGVPGACVPRGAGQHRLSSVAFDVVVLFQGAQRLLSRWSTRLAAGE